MFWTIKVVIGDGPSLGMLYDFMETRASNARLFALMGA